MSEVRAWLRQPTTVAGVSAVFGIAVALLLQQITWAQAIPLLAGAIASAILPDNSAAKQQAQGLALAVVEKVHVENGGSK